MILVLVIFYSIVIIFLIRWYIQRRRIIKCLEKIPGPPPLPLVGNALELNSTTALLPKIMEYNKKYGDIIKISIGPTPSALVISDPDMLKLILSSNEMISKPRQYKFWMRWLGSGLLLANGDKWRKHRKILTPAFHFKILEQIVPIFESNTKVLIKKLKSELGKSSVDVYPIIKLCMLDTICESALGTNINSQKNPASQYVQDIRTMCQIIINRTFSVCMQYDIFYNVSSTYRKEKKCVEYLHNYTNSIINKRLLEFKNKSDEVSSNEDIGTKRKLAFLDLLLEENAKSETFTLENVREEVDTFTFTGHDSTALGVSFTIYCLAENLEIQEKVVEELCTIFHDDKFRSITFRDLNEMKYLECVVKESMRLYPPSPMYYRNVDEDFEYEGVTIPQGLTLIINAFTTHHSPKLYPEPDKFIPERFTSENSMERHPFAYIPFSAGPRNCIGQKYAMMDLKANLAMLLRHFKFLPTVPKHKLVLAAEAVLVSSSGVRVRIEKRNF